jgi:hypothetical protein
MRATQMTLASPLAHARLANLLPSYRTQLGGPHSRAMTLSLYGPIIPETALENAALARSGHAR